MHKFFREQKVTPLAYTTFTVDTFLNITEGKMPVILFSDEGNIVQTMSYTTLQEKDILHFLQ